MNRSGSHNTSHSNSSINWYQWYRDVNDDIDSVIYFNGVVNTTWKCSWTSGGTSGIRRGFTPRLIDISLRWWIEVIVWLINRFGWLNDWLVDPLFVCLIDLIDRLIAINQIKSINWSIEWISVNFTVVLFWIVFNWYETVHWSINLIDHLLYIYICSWIMTEITMGWNWLSSTLTASCCHNQEKTR